MRVFSKSKLMALRQCPKRLWLEVHRPDLRADSVQTQRSFQIGHAVGDLARTLYDPAQQGSLIDVATEGFPGAFERSANLLRQSTQPVFEAGFSAGGVLAFADVMLPTPPTTTPTHAPVNAPTWRMVEVKASTKVKDYHRDDVAVQAYAAQSAGVRLSRVAVAHIDSSWVYPGDQNYQGLLVEQDLTEQAFARQDEVKAWVAQAHAVVAQDQAPPLAVGSHCDQPFACGFYSHCSRNEPQPEYPVYWLPRLSSQRVQALAQQGIDDLRCVPDDQLNERQRRVKSHTLTNTVYFNAAGAAQDLAPFPLPLQFLDFETIQFAVPIWAGTRPYQQIPFQFSLHTVGAAGELLHHEFLDVSGQDPSRALAASLIEHCSGHSGAIFAYNAGFEKSRIEGLAERFADLSTALLAISGRMQDLLPIARARYYHPSQRGSWSIKAVLPAAVPELRYSDLAGVQDGGMAMNAFMEALHPDTDPAQKAQLRAQLLAYCQLDTHAMVRLWQVFAGRTDLSL